MYLIAAALALIVGVLSHYFMSSFIPPQLGSLKRSLAILGAVLRLSRHTLRFIHLGIFVTILAFSIVVFAAPECTKQTIGFIYLLVATAVLTVIWLGQHVGSWVIRSCIDIDIAIY